MHVKFSSFCISKKGQPEQAEAVYGSIIASKNTQNKQSSNLLAIIIEALPYR